MSKFTRALKRISAESAELNKVQDNIDLLASTVVSSPLLNGVLLKEVSLTTGVNSINHKLDRPLVGWLIIRKRANEDIWDLQDTNSSPSKTLILQSSGAVSVDLYVF